MLGRTASRSVHHRMHAPSPAIPPNTNPGTAVKGFCRRNVGPRSVDYEFINKEIILVGPDLIR